MFLLPVPDKHLTNYWHGYEVKSELIWPLSYWMIIWHRENAFNEKPSWCQKRLLFMSLFYKRMQVAAAGQKLVSAKLLLEPPCVLAVWLCGRLTEKTLKWSEELSTGCFLGIYSSLKTVCFVNFELSYATLRFYKMPLQCLSVERFSLVCVQSWSCDILCMICFIFLVS